MSLIKNSIQDQNGNGNQKIRKMEHIGRKLALKIRTNIWNEKKIVTAEEDEVRKTLLKQRGVSIIKDQVRTYKEENEKNKRMEGKCKERQHDVNYEILYVENELMR